jgi:UDP-GlcNAc:undecaprenyl-phosphate GlcNAc-1-phosphate transferase
VLVPSLGEYLAIGACAAMVTFVTTPLVARVARRLGWVAMPNARSVHTTPIPDVGGLAMFAGFVVALGASRAWDAFDPLFSRNSEPWGVLLAAAVIFAVGLLDDVRDISPPAKVAGTVLASLALVWFGATMYYFRLPYVGVLYLSDDWVPLITVLWVLGMSQAINLIDGLDGLAAGIVAIGSGAFFLYSQHLSDAGLLTEPNFGPLFAVITVGICVGFLPHNFNPARIFMGDGGALLLGLLLAASTSLVGGRATADQQSVGQTYFFLAPLVIPLLILGVPVLDTLFAIVRRATRRQGFDVADKGHLHHRLVNLGHGHRRSVLILWAWTGLLSAFVLYPVLSESDPSYLPFGISALAIVLYTVLHPSVRQRRAENGNGADRRASEAPAPEVAAGRPDRGRIGDESATRS